MLEMGDMSVCQKGNLLVLEWLALMLKKLINYLVSQYVLSLCTKKMVKLALKSADQAAFPVCQKGAEEH